MTSVSITAVNGNSQRLDGGAMFGNAPRAVWETWIKPDDVGRIPLNCRAMLVDVGGTKILCETGIGVFFEPKLAERYGVTEKTHKLLENLAALGLSDADIDFVILSHLHFDHAGGLLPSWADQQAGKQDLLFPKAKYVVGREALERADNPHPRDRASFIPGLSDRLKASGRLIVVDGPTHPSVLPQYISFFVTHGHTPGHMHTVVKGMTDQVIFAGDLIPGRAWVHLPITMGYDRFAEQVIDEKKAVYAQSANPKTWFFYTHDHEVAMSRIKPDDKGRFIAYDNIAAPVSFSV